MGSGDGWVVGVKGCISTPPPKGRNRCGSRCPTHLNCSTNYLTRTRTHRWTHIRTDMHNARVCRAHMHAPHYLSLHPTRRPQAPWPPQAHSPRAPPPGGGHRPGGRRPKGRARGGGGGGAAAAGGACRGGGAAGGAGGGGGSGGGVRGRRGAAQVRGGQRGLGGGDAWDGLALCSVRSEGLGVRNVQLVI